MEQDIVLSNPLIEACYKRPDVNMLRLLFACLLQIKADEPINPTRAFTVTAGGISDLVDRENKLNNYGQLKATVEKLMAWTVYVDKKPNGLAGEPDRKAFSVVDSAEYFDGEGRVEIYFGHHIGPHISDLNKFFSKFDPKNLFPLTSGYTARLYTIFREALLLSKGRPTIKAYPVEEFRRIFGLEGKHPRTKDLMQRIIRPGLEQINAKTDIRVKYGQRTGGRKRIVEFQFELSYQVNPDADSKQAPRRALPAKPLTLDEFVKKHARPGESAERARDRLYVSWTKQSGGAG